MEVAEQLMAASQQHLMEAQEQLPPPSSILIQSPYDIVKTEPTGGSPDMHSNPSAQLFAPFAIPTSFMTNNNHETHNHNHSRNCAKAGRTLTADRKRPYPCNICPSRFGSKMELEEHQNSHTGQKPFECDVCKARFNRRSTLWNHKRIHSDAKPFVCSVCQMTFKWKNSLKCHKEMHLRKNESSSLLDADLRQLTYATAAKRNKEAMEGGGTSPSSAPLITTATNKKKSKSSSSSSSSASLVAIQPRIPTTSASSVSSLQHSLSLPTATIDLDAASLELVNQNNGNILVQLCGEVDPHLGRHSILGGMDESLLGHFGDIKQELIYPSHSQHMICNQQQQHHNLFGDIKGEAINVNLNIPIGNNVFNFRSLGHQQLPSVHHLTSTSLPSVSVQMDYQSDLSQPQYVLTTQDNNMMNISYQQGLDTGCVILATGQDYMPNFDYSLINGASHVPTYEATTSAQVEAHQSGPSNGGQQQMVAVDGSFEGKSIPHDRW